MAELTYVLRTLWDERSKEMLADLGQLQAQEVANLLCQLWKLVQSPTSCEVEDQPTSGMSDLLLDVAWEKLHIGHWKDVSQVWRDAYSLISVLKVITQLQATAEHTAGHTPAEPRPESETPDATLQVAPGPELCAACLRQLDMAALMGGPKFRPEVDSLIQQLSQHTQHATGRGVDPTTSHAVSGKRRREADGGALDEEPSSAKRIPRDATEGSIAERHEQPEEQGEGEGTTAGEGSGDAAPRDGEAEVAAAAASWRVRPPLPPGSLSEEGVRPPVAHLPSLETFLHDYMAAEGGPVPVIITGGMEAWPAITRWQDLNYLKQVAGLRTVPVEVGQHYLADGWGQKLMTLAEFVEQHLAAGDAPAPAASRGYLAQHALFDQVPALRSDILEPEYCVLGEGEVQAVNAWLGPAGTVTPMHHDPHHNLLAQVVGRKYVRLYHPQYTAQLRPFPDGHNTNSSQLDLDALGEEDRAVLCALPCIDCVLQPGQMLYIPPGWWHYVRSLSLSFSVSFWWR